MSQVAKATETSLEPGTAKMVERESTDAPISQPGRTPPYLSPRETFELEAWESANLALRIRRALSNEEFSLLFQPVFEAEPLRVVSFEALIRWDDPDTGLVGPDQFIPFAEEHGYIERIGRWVLVTGIQQLAEWRKSPETSSLVLALNVSPIELQSMRYVERLGELLEQYRIPPSRLTLEIIESEAVEANVDTLEAIAALGVGLAVDDFGTGYSSLSYLNSMPFHALKVDQSFVKELTSGSGRALVKGMLMMAEALGLRSVVEGVETAEQLEALLEFDVDLLQGFHLGRPMPASRILQFCHDQPSGNDPRTLATRAASVLVADAALDTTTSALLSCDITQTITWCNPELEDLFGYNPGELVGKSISDLVPQAMASRHKSQAADFMGDPTATRAMGDRALLEGRRKNGDPIFVDLNLWRYQQDKQTVVVTSVREIPEPEQKAVQNLQQQLQARDALIATVAHELRTPLTSILGYAEILSDSPTERPTEDSEFIEWIRSEAESLSYIVDDLLAAAHSRAGALRTLSEPIELLGIAQGVATSLGRQTGSDYPVTGPPTPSIGDKKRVQQILRNLIVNAHKHGGPAVSIEVKSGMETTSISVIDDGPQIPEEDRERIFEAYGKAAQDLSIPGSIGLGLTISRTLARSLGGDLTYDHQDGNSHFELSLKKAPQALPD